MKDSKLMILLETLTKPEVKRWLKYVQAQTMHQNSQALTFAKILVRQFPQFNYQKLTKEKVFQKTWPDEPYTEQKIYDLMSQLVKSIERFLVLEALKEKPVQQKLIWMQVLRQKKLESFYAKELENIKTKNSRSVDDNFYFEQYLIANEEDQYYLEKEAKTRDETLQNKADRLDQFYLAAKLKNSAEMLNRSNIIASNYELNMLPELLGYITSNTKLMEIPNIAIYYNIIKMIQEPEVESHYHNLLDTVQQHQTDLPQGEIKTVYEYAQNYCVGKINKGVSAFLEELFKVNQVMLTKGLLHTNDQLSHFDFKNMVTVGIRLKKFDWVEEFIETYHNDIKEKYKQTAYIYNSAQLYYSKGLLEKALELLRDVEFQEISYNLGTKSLLLKIYYDQNEIEALPYLMESFKSYLKRNQLLSQQQIDIHLNLIKFANRLFKLKNDHLLHKERPTRDSTTLIERDLGQEKLVANKGWLRDKLGELVEQNTVLVNKE